MGRDQKMERGWGVKKGIEMHCVHGPTLHNECKHDVLHTYTNKNFKEKNLVSFMIQFYSNIHILCFHKNTKVTCNGVTPGLFSYIFSKS